MSSELVKDVNQAAGVSEQQCEDLKRPKTAKELAKEAKKKEKNEKYEQKQEKLKQQAEQKLTNKPKKEDKKDKKKREIIYDIHTKLGDKKVVSNQLPESYSPKYVEAAWYAWWEKSGFFKPEYNEKLGIF